MSRSIWDAYPATTIYPQGGPADRPPSRIEVGCRRVLAALEAYGRELSSGEIGAYVLNSWPGRDREAVLSRLLDERLVTIRLEPLHCRSTPSRLFALARKPGGGDR